MPLTSRVMGGGFASGAVKPIYSDIRPSSSASYEDSPFKEPITDYVHNVLIGSVLRKLQKRHLLELEDIELIQSWATKTLHATGSAQENLTMARLRSGLHQYIRNTEQRLRVPRPLPKPYAKNVAWFSATVGLDETEAAILQLLLVVQGSALEAILDVLGLQERVALIQLVATLVARPKATVQRALSPDGRLIQTGLVLFSRIRSTFIPKLTLKEGISDLILSPPLHHSRRIAHLLPEVPRTDLDWSDFEHVDEQATLARSILASALRSQAQGVNVLFYGATGAGKTALASAIAYSLGAKLYNVVNTSDKDDGAGTSGRLSSLVLGEKVLSNGTALLLFDELEDLFAWSHGLFGGETRGTPSMSKLWFNQFLEMNRIPIIWISNRVEGIDSAFLRRFTYVVEFSPLGARQRATILMRHIGDNSSMTADDAHAVAARFPVSPAQVASAVRATRLITPNGNVERTVLERILGPTEKLVGQRAITDASDFQDSEYDVGAVNASVDLEQLSEQLAKWKPSGSAGLTLCLYGPPGTGKSEFVRYLAQRMGRPVLYRSASDIMRPFVGETEQQIAAAFREAGERDALLLFDEVDSFLRDRRLALRNWEITETNEFLQQLERQRGVVVCTTNLWQDIDTAALRRFIIKVQFRYLTREQSTRLFTKLFRNALQYPLDPAGATLLGSTLGKLNNVALGDMAAVSRRLAALGSDKHSLEHVLDLLVEEVRAKGSPAHRIGF